MRAFVINMESRPDRMIEFQKNDLPFEVERFNAFRTNPGWIGCADSHLAVMRDQREFPFVIFEDDCVMLDSWAKVENAMLQLPRGWDALWLGGSLYQTVERYSNNTFRAKGLYTHHAVIYNSRAMIDYYLNNYNREMPIDNFSSSVISHLFSCFLIHPMIAAQRVNHSDIEGKVCDYAPWFNALQNELNSK